MIRARVFYAWDGVVKVQLNERFGQFEGTSLENALNHYFENHPDARALFTSQSQHAQPSAAESGGIERATTLTLLYEE